MSPGLINAMFFTKYNYLQFIRIMHYLKPCHFSYPSPQEKGPWVVSGWFETLHFLLLFNNSVNFPYPGCCSCAIAFFYINLIWIYSDKTKILWPSRIFWDKIKKEHCFFDIWSQQCGASIRFVVDWFVCSFSLKRILWALFKSQFYIWVYKGVHRWSMNTKTVKYIMCVIQIMTGP